MLARTRGRIIAAVALALTAVPLAHAQGLPLTPSCTATDWPMFGHDAGRSFASPDACLSPVSAPTLAPAWFYDASSPVTAQPTVADGTVFVGAFDGRFHALDANATSPTGTARWVFDIHDCSHACDNSAVYFGAIPDSAAVTTAGGRRVVVFGGGDTVFVLDTRDGSVVASECLDPVDRTCQGGSGYTTEIEGSPLVIPHANGSVAVVVGTDVNEHEGSGPAGVVALTLTPSLQLVPAWQYDPATDITTVGLTPYDPAHLDAGGCGDVWSSPALVGGTVVFGTGNCQPDGGVETERTVALDADNGSLRWSAGTTNDGLDLDRGATPNALGGGAVGEGGKDGVYYEYDSAGRLLAATPVATSASIGGMIGSTALGAVTVGGQRHRVVFAPTAIPVSSADPQGSITNDVMHPGQAFGLHALDLDASGGPAVLWDAPVGPAYGAAVFTGGVVLVPDTFSDSLVVIDAATGAILRQQPLESPPSSPPAVVGSSVYMGSGTTEQGLPVLSSIGGVWAFRTAT